MDNSAPKRRRFVDEYLVDLNGKQAVIRAGYSPKTAHVQASRLLSDAKIQAAIALAVEAQSRRTGITADVVLGELLRLGRVDIGDAFDDDGNLKPLKQIPEDVRRAIAGIEVDEIFEGRGADRRSIGYTRKVKFWDKRGALELLGKHLKLWTDVVKHEGLDSLANALRAAEERVSKR